MSNTKITVLIVTGVLLVCIIGACVVLGLYFSGGRNMSNFMDIFHNSRVAVNETKTLDLTGASSVTVQCPSGSITVEPGSEPSVKMEGSIWTADKKDSYIDVETENGGIVIKPALDVSLFNWSDINITVFLPQDCGLNLNVSGASANTSVQGLKLGNVNVNCASGRADLSGCTGGTLYIGTASGGVSVSDSTFTSLNAVCQSGNIDIKNTAAQCTINCTSGRVNVTDVKGALDIGSVSGGVTADLSQTDISPVKIGVTSGDIQLYLNPAAAFDLNADTTSGGIRCDFDRTVSGNSSGNPAGDHISGKCNGGGVQVTLNTLSGGISILKK